MAIAAALLVALALAGVVYQIAAAVLVRASLDCARDERVEADGSHPYTPRPAHVSHLNHPPHPLIPSAVEGPPVSILKPLHGGEPNLAANLATFAAQTYPGAIEIVCGVARADDPARAAIPGDPCFVRVVDPRVHGSNAKVSNLINLMAAATHDILIVSDSDIAVAPDWLARVVAALDATGVGAVTCLYHGRGDAGGWSRLAAAGIGWSFLPSVVVGLRLGLAQPCMGSTIALRRATLDAIGGFAAFADILADDHAIGAAVRGLGLRVAVPGFTVAHGCAETSLASLIAHELRWNATIRWLDPAGYAGHGLVNPLPIAVIATAFAPAVWPVIAIAIAARIVLVVSVTRATRHRAAPLWWLPARDFLGFGLFLAGFLVQSVAWRGSRLRMLRDGRIGDRG